MVTNEDNLSTVVMANGNPNWNSAYGVLEIKSMDCSVYEWTLRINTLRNNLILFGLVDFGGDHSCNMVTEHEYHYVVNGCGVLREHGTKSKRLHGGECDEGTVIKFQLDLSEKCGRNSCHIFYRSRFFNNADIFVSYSTDPGNVAKYSSGVVIKSRTPQFLTLTVVPTSKYGKTTKVWGSCFRTSCDDTDSRINLECRFMREAAASRSSLWRKLYRKTRYSQTFNVKWQHSITCVGNSECDSLRYFFRTRYPPQNEARAFGNCRKDVFFSRQWTSLLRSLRSLRPHPLSVEERKRTADK